MMTARVITTIQRLRRLTHSCIVVMTLAVIMGEGPSSWARHRHHGRGAVIMGEGPSSGGRNRHHGRGAVIMGEGTVIMGEGPSSWARDGHHGGGTVIMGEERSSWGRNGHHGRRYYGALFEGKHATQQGTIASTLHS